MSLRPEIFISAGPELDAARKAVKQALSEIGAEPVEQLDFSIEYGPLQGVLNQAISKCEAVIHLVGPRYGIEPAERTLGAARRSFPQYEVDVAKSLNRPVYFFIAGPEYSFPRSSPELDTLRELQDEHRHAIELGGQNVQQFSNPDDLGRKIRTLRQRLIVRRRLAVLPRASLGEGFIGRRQLLGSIAEQLHAGKPVVLHPSDVSAAHGGTGATTLAVELGWKLYEDRKRDFVFFLPAGPRADIEVSIAALARNDALALLPDEVGGHRAKLEAVFKWFEAEENAGKWLVIIDGIDHIPTWLQMRTLLPRFARGDVLLTSRLTIWPSVEAHALSALPAEPARELLIELLYPNPGAVPYPDRGVLDQMAEMLGRVPLALTLAAGYLRDSGTPLREFLPQWLPDPKQPERPWRKLTLATIIDHSVSELDPATRSLLRLLSCLAPEPAAIPLALFDYRGDWAEIRAALATLKHRALIHFDESANVITIHRAVRETIRDRLPPADVTTALGAARTTLDSVLRRGESGGGVLLRERLIPHCRALLGQLNGHPLEEHASFLVQNLAHWLKDCGRPTEAEPLYRRALAIHEKHQKEDKANLILRLRDLASVLRGPRSMKEAESLYRRAVSLSESVHGQDRPEIVPDLQNLANCLRARNRLFEAEQLLRRALEIEERFAGRHHPRTAIALNRLAGVLEIERRITEAEGLYRRALEIDESVAGPKHPRVVIVLHNLAGILAEKGRFVEAEELYRRALAIDQEKFGRDHPETSPALKSLAFVIEAQNRFADAEALLRRALAIDEKTYGSRHTEVAVDLANLACLAQTGGRHAEAAEMLRCALEIFVSARARFRREYPHLNAALPLYAVALKEGGASDHEVQQALDRIVPRITMRPKRTILPEILEESQAEPDGELQEA